MSQRLDEECDDHFESETLTLELDGGGRSRLLLPRRCTAVTTLKTRDSAGTLTTQASTVYRLHSSLDSTGAKPIYGDLDWVDVIPLSAGLTSVLEGPYVFPCGTGTVQVAGTFGYTVTPFNVKRAVALMVWDHFKHASDQVRRLSRWTSNGEAFEAAVTTPTGLPEVDAVIEQRHRDASLPVG